MTTLGNLRTTYSEVSREYNMKKFELAQELSKTKERMEHIPSEREALSEKAAILELQYNAVSEQKSVYDDFIQAFMEEWNTRFQQVSTENQTEAAKDYYDELDKVMKVAMRMCRGDIVPQSDEKKLMEFDGKLYQMAKNAQRMAQRRERKKWDSLWGDEEEKQYEDPIKAADDQETSLQGPEVVSADEVIAEIVVE